MRSLINLDILSDLAKSFYLMKTLDAGQCSTRGTCCATELQQRGASRLLTGIVCGNWWIFVHGFTHTGTSMTHSILGHGGAQWGTALRRSLRACTSAGAPARARRRRRRRPRGVRAPISRPAALESRTASPAR